MKEVPSASIDQSENIQTVIETELLTISFQCCSLFHRRMKTHNKALTHLQHLSMIRNFYEMFFEICLVLTLTVKLYEQLSNKYSSNKKRTRTITMIMINEEKEKTKETLYNKTTYHLILRNISANISFMLLWLFLSFHSSYSDPLSLF